MKNTINIAIALLLLVLASCSKDFLETKPSQYVSEEQLLEASKLNPALVEKASIAGIYSIMYTAGSGGIGGHIDFGHRAYDVFTDMLCGDMALGALNYGWYGDFARLTPTVDYTSNRNYAPWRYYYRIIYAANSIIDRLGGTDATPEEEVAKHYMGQAKAMRAYAYFYLANLFAESYDPASNLVPIYTSTKEVNQPLSTTQEVYALMVKDLEDAIALLATYTRSAKNEVDTTVAQALLAYAYAAMGNYTKVAELSTAVINSGVYPLMSKDEVVGGFNDVTTKGWIWGVDLTIEIGLGLASWWGQCDIFTYGYASVGDTKIMDSGLYANIRADDVRKTQFLDKSGDVYHMTPYKKFYDPNRKIDGQRTVTTDYVYLRIAEMYLLRAEAEANLGNEAAAKTTLKQLLGERIGDASYVDALSGQALLDEIYLQTRIELWGEGKSYLAMKRNKATVVRGSNHLFFVGEAIPYNDDRLSFEIPQLEIQNNPNIVQQ